MILDSWVFLTKGEKCHVIASKAKLVLNWCGRRRVENVGDGSTEASGTFQNFVALPSFPFDLWVSSWEWRACTTLGGVQRTTADVDPWGPSTFCLRYGLSLAWNMGQAFWPVSTVHLAIFEIRDDLFVCFSFVFWVRVSLRTLGCPGIFSVD